MTLTRKTGDAIGREYNRRPDGRAPGVPMGRSGFPARITSVPAHPYRYPYGFEEVDLAAPGPGNWSTVSGGETGYAVDSSMDTADTGGSFWIVKVGSVVWMRWKKTETGTAYWFSMGVKCP